MSMVQCPCGSEQTFIQCCSPYIQGIKRPKTPEALMRSRYSAYVLAKMKYIASTMRGEPKVNFRANEVQAWAKSVKWLHLDVIRTFEKQGEGVVEFKAYYKEKGQSQCLSEISRFHWQNNRWFYVGQYQDWSEVAQ
ncbi:MAG TPA: YchJ family metal-binding protein [Gammaproteobacteria bacterium]|nr:YchJ family metal-binding protein [Gammaproteobacteria bacterium]